MQPPPDHYLAAPGRLDEPGGTRDSYFPDPSLSPTLLMGNGNNAQNRVNTIPANRNRTTDQAHKTHTHFDRSARSVGCGKRRSESGPDHRSSRSGRHHFVKSARSTMRTHWEPVLITVALALTTLGLLRCVFVALLVVQANPPVDPPLEGRRPGPHDALILTSPPLEPP